MVVLPRRFARTLRRLLFVAAGTVTLLSVVVVGLSASSTMRFVPVLSNSMAPRLPVGSIAVTVPVNRTDVGVGDVIVFANPLRPSIRVIHRVTRLFGPDDAARFSNWSADSIFFETRGDNNPVADPWVATISAATVWRSTGSVAFVGFPAVWFAAPAMRLGLFLFGGVVIALLAVIAIWRRPTAPRVNPADGLIPGEPRESVQKQVVSS